MTPKTLPILCATLLFLQSNFPAAASNRASAGSTRQQVQAVPAGSLVEVRLYSKQKFRGRLGEISVDGFVVQTAASNKTGDEKLAFTDVRSFRVVSSHTCRKVLIGVGIGLGIAALVGYLIVRSYGKALGDLTSTTPR